MKDEIFIEIKQNYGNDAYYPICDTSKKLAQLAGTRTLTPDAIRIIKSMGIKVTVKSAVVTL